ncbi:MAG: phosphopentomutase [Acidobacteria bacterium]|nr:phosphopentomutase [Acidobacteriota bacterium]MBV9475196.1 phosphopentomutase [Acidobacteriota bacterium]
MTNRRVITLICDSLGVGELPDARDFGDEGSNTLGHVLEAQHPQLPTLTRLGLLHTLPSPASTDIPAAAFGRMNEVSAGKDTTTGHWEMMGLIVADPFRTYPNGFPREIIDEYERRIGRKTLGNKPASGTVILDELGEEHMRTGSPIVYTSADSVFQVAAHEDVIPVEELWRICAIARELMRGEHNIGRIIARPFVGSGAGHFKRTANRKDFSVRPTGETVVERAHNAGREVIGLGKIADIFDRVGIGREIRTESNSDGMRKTLELVRESNADFIFTNLVDFDSKYGHRNDAVGYARALETFDGELAALLASLREDDLVFISADHGCDPTDVSTDHTREYVPLIITGPRIRGARPLGTRTTFADLGATVCDYLRLPSAGLAGTSALPELGVE